MTENSDASPRLALPYIAPGQAQKHVTHNAAIEMLDALVQLSVVQVDALVPPSDPAAGEVYALGAVPEAAWAGQGGMLALWDGTGWMFLTPAVGWRAYDLDTQRALSFDGTGWTAEIADLSSLDGVGIRTGWDGVNRLSVAAQASLFSHEGSGGHQIKVNKATASDTASLLFQSNWTGHAEMGLAGDTSFAVKVSPDGSTWFEALKLDPAAQEVGFAPDGVQRARLTSGTFEVDVPLSGDAVQNTILDIDQGRVMKVGAFGLGGRDLVGTTMSNGHADLPSGFFGGSGGAGINFPGASRYYPFLNLTRRIGAGSYRQVRLFCTGPTIVMRESSNAGASWSDDIDFITNRTMVGTVSQTAGTPTGAVVERGANANGSYVRFADGTQICTATRTTNTAIATASGGLFTNGADLTATHAAGFAAGQAPQVTLQPLVPAGTAHDIGATLVAAGTASASYRLTRLTADATARDISCQITATGRWF